MDNFPAKTSVIPCGINFHQPPQTRRDGDGNPYVFFLFHFTPFTKFVTTTYRARNSWSIADIDFKHDIRDKSPMARDDGYTRYTMRIPTPLYERIKEEAGEKSVNAEILSTLEAAYPPKSIDVRVLSMFLENAVSYDAPDERKEFIETVNRLFAKAGQHWEISADGFGVVKFIPFNEAVRQRQAKNRDDRPAESDMTVEHKDGSTTVIEAKKGGGGGREPKRRALDL